MNEKKFDTFDPKLTDNRMADALGAALEEDSEVIEKKDPYIGKKFNSYEIETLIGKGGMGKVYLAKHEVIGKRAALKICDRVQTDSLGKRFLREAQILARLEHPKLVTSFDFGTFEEGSFLIMPYIESLSASELLKKRGTLDTEEVFNIIRQAAEGLAAAHEAGVVHRDIKPSNMLVDKSGSVWMTDFGISQLVDAESQTILTRDQETLGTPLYISPEQAKGGKADHRSDIYSLGATFYHLLFGKAPYKAESALAIIHMHIDAELNFPQTEKNDSRTQHAMTCIRKMMHKDPDQRPQSMGELIDLLDLSQEASSPKSSMRFSEETIRQIVSRAHDIEMEEKRQEEMLKTTDLREVGRDLGLKTGSIDKAREEIEREKAEMSTTVDVPRRQLTANNEHQVFLKILFVSQIFATIGLSMPVWQGSPVGSMIKDVGGVGFNIQQHYRGITIIPVCAIISEFVLLWALFYPQSKPIVSLKSLKYFVIANILFLLLNIPMTQSSEIGILSLVIFILDLFIIWKIFGGLAAMAQGAGCEARNVDLRSSRIIFFLLTLLYWVVIVIPIAMYAISFETRLNDPNKVIFHRNLLGSPLTKFNNGTVTFTPHEKTAIVNAISGQVDITGRVMRKWVIQTLCLPGFWIIGWFFLLRPLLRLRSELEAT